MSVRTIFTAAAAALLLALLAAEGDAQAIAGPFTAMAGNWSGDGTLTMSNGEQERMRCRASYAVGQDGENVRLNIRCASDSFNFDLASQVANQGGRLSGEWSEATRNATGTITGRANRSQIQAEASSAGFSANLSLTTQGNRQSVAIRPQGMDVQRVALTLNRR
jgi:hypothetical protein